MSRQVLPTAPSPTTTHFIVCIMKCYLFCVNTCNRPNINKYSKNCSLNTFNFQRGWLEKLLIIHLRDWTLWTISILHIMATNLNGFMVDMPACNFLWLQLKTTMNLTCITFHQVLLQNTKMFYYPTHVILNSTQKKNKFVYFSQNNHPTELQQPRLWYLGCSYFK